MANKKILIVEDDEIFSEILNEYLFMKDFEVAIATDGLSGVALHESFHPDLVLLDVALPGMNGIQVAENIRMKDRITPILFMSGSENTNEDQIKSFKSGGNDHLEKGFHLDVLHCKIIDRLNSQIIPGDSTFQFKLGNDILTISRTHLRYKNIYIDLIERESKILKILFSNPNQAVEREKFTQNVWKFWSESNNHMLTNYIGKIKEKLSPFSDILDIKAVYGNGYMLQINLPEKK